jgi:hypothetical protein
MELVIHSKRHGDQILFFDLEDIDIIKSKKWSLMKGKNTFYLVHSRRGEGTTRLHILLMGAPGIDHIDGNGLNNRRSNLRLASQAQNGKNKRIGRANTSGFKGVYFNIRVQKYYVIIIANYKRIFGGIFLDSTEAAKRYNELAIKHHGDFAKLNPIP